MLASSRVDKQSKKTIAQLLNQRELSRPDESDDSDDEEEEPHPQKTSLGSVHREPAKPAKKPPAASRTPVASCTYILIFGIWKCKQCKLKTSDETGKFCHLHKRQP